MRFTLSAGDIFGGHFFQYEINCGYGLNSTQLIRRYRSIYSEKVWVIDNGQGLDQGEAYLPADDLTLRYGPCQDSAYPAQDLIDFERNGNSAPYCEGSNDNADCMCNYKLSISSTSQCKCINKFPSRLYAASATEEEQDAIPRASHRVSCLNIGVTPCFMNGSCTMKRNLEMVWIIFSREVN